MTNDDVLFAYRLRVLASARELGSVAAACRLHGVHCSTFYRRKNAVDRFGCEILRPRGRRAPQMPNSIPVLVEQRIVTFALGFAGCGPARIASELRREKWGGFTVSANGVYRMLRRHGIHTRALRNGLLAGYASPPEPAREPEPERHIHVDHPGELVQVDCFCIGRLSGTKGVVWQYTAIGAGWELERISTDNGSESRNHAFDAELAKLGTVHTLISPGRPQSNGFVERVQRTILDECRKPTFARYLALYNYDRTHSGRHTKGRIPAEVLGTAKMWRQQSGCVATL